MSSMSTRSTPPAGSHQPAHESIVAGVPPATPAFSSAWRGCGHVEFTKSKNWRRNPTPAAGQLGDPGNPAHGAEPQHDDRFSDEIDTEQPPAPLVTLEPTPRIVTGSPRSSFAKKCRCNRALSVALPSETTLERRSTSGVSQSIVSKSTIEEEL